MGNVLDMFFRGGLGEGQSVDSCVVTNELADINAGYTLVAKDTGKRYAILHETLYQILEPYIRKDLLYFDEALAHRLVKERKFSE